MNSMDLVHRHAGKSLGLLSTPIRAKTGLRLMELLMDGHLSREDGMGGHMFLPGFPFSTIAQVVSILRDLAKDAGGADRAWVFQEEYISGIKMDLLVPLALWTGWVRTEAFCLVCLYGRNAAPSAKEERTQCISCAGFVRYARDLKTTTRQQVLRGPFVSKAMPEGGSFIYRRCKCHDAPCLRLCDRLCRMNNLKPQKWLNRFRS